MKRFLLLLVVISIQYSVVHAQAASAFVPTEKTLLWKIDGNGLDSSSYLFGTIHLIPESDFIIKPKLEKALSEVSKVTFEINMEDMTDPSLLFVLMNKIMMPSDSTLEDLVTEMEYQQITKFFSEGSLPLPMEIIKKIKPAFLSMMDPTALSGGEFAENTVSYELNLFELCQKNQKVVDGLETIEFQIGLFDMVPLKDQADMLIHAVQEVKDTTQENALQELIDVYLLEDIQGMQQLMDVDAPEMMGIGEELLVNRNIKWIPTMGTMMKKQRTLFAVGAGHLGGEEGVISLLRKAGYQVHPVME